MASTVTIVISDKIPDDLRDMCEFYKNFIKFDENPKVVRFENDSASADKELNSKHFLDDLYKYFDMLTEDMSEIEDVLDEKATEDKDTCLNEHKDTCLNEDKQDLINPLSVTDKIIYNNRDILDLASNLKNAWNYQPSQVKTDMFDNTSVSHRLKGGKIPRHSMKRCGVDNCDFMKLYYF